MRPLQLGVLGVIGRADGSMKEVEGIIVGGVAESGDASAEARQPKPIVTQAPASWEV